MPASPCPFGVPDWGTLGSYMQGWEYNNFLWEDIMSAISSISKTSCIEGDPRERQ